MGVKYGKYNNQACSWQGGPLNTSCSSCTNLPHRTNPTSKIQPPHRIVAKRCQYVPRRPNKLSDGTSKIEILPLQLPHSTGGYPLTLHTRLMTQQVTHIHPDNIQYLSTSEGNALEPTGARHVHHRSKRTRNRKRRGRPSTGEEFGLYHPTNPRHNHPHHCGSSFVQVDRVLATDLQLDLLPSNNHKLSRRRVNSRTQEGENTGPFPGDRFVAVDERRTNLQSVRAPSMVKRIMEFKSVSHKLVRTVRPKIVRWIG